MICMLNCESNYTLCNIARWVFNYTMCKISHFIKNYTQSTFFHVPGGKFYNWLKTFTQPAVVMVVTNMRCAGAAVDLSAGCLVIVFCICICICLYSHLYLYSNHMRCRTGSWLAGRMSTDCFVFVFVLHVFVFTSLTIFKSHAVQDRQLTCRQDVDWLSFVFVFLYLHLYLYSH